MYETVAISMRGDLRVAIKAAAEADGRSVSNWVSRACEAALKRAGVENGPWRDPAGGDAGQKRAK